MAFKNNWLVWYNLMILLRWSRLCAIGLISNENYPRELVPFRWINLTVVSLYWEVQTSASFSWWHCTLGSLPFSTLSRGRIGSQRQKNKVKIFSSATFSQVLSHSSAVGSCGFSSEMSPLTFPWASFSHIPILISLHTQKRPHFNFEITLISLISPFFFSASSLQVVEQCLS